MSVKFSAFIILIYFSYVADSKITIMKCCPENKYVDARRACKKINDSVNLEDVIIYDKNIMPTGKKLMDVFQLVDSKTFNFSRFEAFDFSSRYNNYLIEDGTLMQELPNTYNRFTRIETNQFCIDIALPNGRHILKPTVKLWTIPPNQEEPFDITDFVVIEAQVYLSNATKRFDRVYVSCLNNMTTNAFEKTFSCVKKRYTRATGMLMSSVFMVLVLVVYSLLPELRNLCGMILMAYVASLLGAFLMLSTLYLLTSSELNTDNVCLGFSFMIYYFFLSCFCWMNVMSIDIWWTFRGYAKARPIHRRGESFKFAMYCLYAFGLPAAMTVAMGVLDQQDLTHIPWFIKPNMLDYGCFLEGGGKFVYLYVPMLIIIILNWILFLMTAFNIWRLSRGTAVLDSPAAGNPSAHRTHRHRLMLYLKLSVVMGVSWLLEIISYQSPKFCVYLTDAYNLLIGVFIFLIFVCKKKIFKKLQKKFAQRTRWSPISKSRSASVSSDSEETTQISTSPSGSSYYNKH